MPGDVVPRVVQLSESDLRWLKDNHHNTSFTLLAKRFKVDPVTIKRILVRHGLRELDGAKYQVSFKSIQKVWNRPCMACGCTKTRPKFFYFCVRCRRARGLDDEAH